MTHINRMRPFNDLSEGKGFLISLLKSHQFTDIIDTDIISQYTHWDLEATHKGERYVFELKNRTFPSTKYNDTAINYDKYKYLLDCPYHSVLVTFWTDCWCMIDIKSCKPDSDINRVCPHQTRFRDHTLINKHMVAWNIQNKILLQYD